MFKVRIATTALLPELEAVMEFIHFPISTLSSIYQCMLGLIFECGQKGKGLFDRDRNRDKGRDRDRDRKRQTKTERDRQHEVETETECRRQRIT